MNLKSRPLPPLVHLVRDSHLYEDTKKYTECNLLRSYYNYDFRVYEVQDSYILSLYEFIKKLKNRNKNDI